WCSPPLAASLLRRKTQPLGLSRPSLCPSAGSSGRAAQVGTPCSGRRRKRRLSGGRRRPRGGFSALLLVACQPFIDPSRGAELRKSPVFDAHRREPGIRLHWADPPVVLDVHPERGAVDRADRPSVRDDQSPAAFVLVCDPVDGSKYACAHLGVGLAVVPA